MGIQMLEEMLNLIRNIGDVKSVNMYDEHTIYISGETNDGNAFDFNFKIKEKENA